MHSDGRVLPGPKETLVLLRLGLVRTDELPDIAALWLASDLLDTESVRQLAGHDPHDPWMLEQLLSDSLEEANMQVALGPAEVRAVAVDWVTATWREAGDTRWAVATLARLGETYPDFDLGRFIGLDDEWIGGWGRLEPDLKEAAKGELDYFLHGGASATGQ